MMKSNWIRTSMLLAGSVMLLSSGCSSAWWHVLYVGIPVGVGMLWGSSLSPI